ncbi:MAG: hypothetical protein GC157_07595 [Frankiales bacterium]|nr:hypothetical protein [Frankiales bacterium]
MKPRSLELTLGPDVSVFGEVTEQPDARGCVLLLHDRGSDLDLVRPFAASLARLELTTVLLDLPGHGLSEGDWDADGARAVGAALDECRRLHPHIATVAVGSACELLYAVPPASVLATALVAPTLDDADLAGAEPWRVIPAIALADPCDEVPAQSMERLGRWIRAWSLRLHVHYLDPPDGARDRWTAHMTHSVAAFVAEQIAYASVGEPALHPPVPPGVHR